MTQAQHTPGPWRTFAAHEPKRGIVVELGSHDQFFVGMGGGADDVRAVDQANANLIAAAPELLAACEAAERSMRYFLSTRNQPEVAQLQAAIAKARGGAQ